MEAEQKSLKEAKKEEISSPVPSGLIKLEEKTTGNFGATDIILGNVHLIHLTKTPVRRGYYFSFMKSSSCFYIGKDKEKCGSNSILLEDESISPLHARLFWRDGKCYIHDEGSSHGTFINEQKLISCTPYPLADICKLQFGDLVFLYQIESMQSFFNRISSQSEQTILTKEEDKKNIKEKEEKTSSGYVIAEFILLSLDSPAALPHHCEILSNKNQFIIGRSKECDYQVEFKDKYVAEEQAAIVYSSQEQAFMIKSLVKENPIFINNQRVKDVDRLKSGDILRLGVASNAPKVRFSLEDSEKDDKKSQNLSDLIDVLERGKVYSLGNSAQCNIRLEDPVISGAILEMQVPERLEHLLITKIGHNEVKVSVDGQELKEKESRAVSLYQTINIGSFYSLVHNHQNFIVPRIAKQFLLSELVPNPQRGFHYGIGNYIEKEKERICIFRIESPECQNIKLVEIQVPAEGEFFVIQKVTKSDIPVTLDGEIIGENTREQVNFGVNQVLKIGDYVWIRNNHRTLPPAIASFSWGKLFYIIFLCVFFALLAIGIGLAVQKYGHYFEDFLSEQNKIKEYQKNVFYISVVDKTGKNLSSGTGFLLVQKDTYDQDVYFLVTCKHVIEPWKFENHLEKNGKIFNEKGEEILDSSQEGISIFAWPYQSQALDSKTRKYIPKNSFTNSFIEDKLGEIEIVRKGEDEYEELEKGLRCHNKKSNQDIAILKLKPKDKTWKYNFYSWRISERKQIEVGETVLVLGYPLGGSRLLDKEGMVVPVSAEGKLASDCKDFAFLEIDVNQNQGASGGPIVDKKGNVLGILTFSDKEKKWIYGIHGHHILNFMK